jgi:hypothetical protein
MVRQSWGPSRNYRRSVACIAATHGGQFEELFSDRSRVFSGLESSTIREVSGTEETEPPPKFAAPSNQQSVPLRLPCRPLWFHGE